MATYVYRFYNPTTGEHFYTPFANERNNIILTNPAFNYEGVGWTEPATADRDIFRYYRFDTKLHFYTASVDERAFVERTFGATFAYEGSNMRAASVPSVAGAPQAVWRFYDPATGLHFLTASDGERDFVRQVLPTWNLEGAAFYVAPAPQRNPVGTEIDDTLIAAASAPRFGETMRGLGGADTMTGGDGADVLYGGEGQDSLSGGADNDTLFGDAGNDTLAGGSNPDILYGGDGNDFLSYGAGNDTMYGDAGNDEFFGQAAGSVLIYGGAGNDTVVVNPTDGSLIVYGEDGNDSLSSAIFVANYGPFRGGFYNYPPSDDQLYGGAGDDTLEGLSGHDTMTGGPGADIFLFDPEKQQSGGQIMPNNLTLITDFTPGVDKIKINDVPGLLYVKQSFTNYSNGAGLTGVKTSMSAGNGTNLEIIIQGVTQNQVADDWFIVPSF